MQKHQYTTAKLFLRHAVFIGLFTFFSGCAPVDDGLQPSPTTPQNTPEKIHLTPEMIPVEQITNLPTHAQTATPQPQAVETSIREVPAIEEQLPIAPDPNIDSLFGSETTFEQADLLIKRPGMLSQLISPFRVIAFVDPGPDNLVQVRLLGENGQTLAEKAVKVMDYLGLDNGNMITDLEFKISGLSELGRIEFSVMDEFGRVKAHNSVDVILLSTGETNRNYAPEIQERVIIQYPLANYMVEGNSLLVSGMVRTRSSQPLSLTLSDESGRLLGEGSASVVLSEEYNYGIFIGEIPYQLENPMWVRLSVLIPGERIPGVEFIKTMVLVISP